MSYYNTNGQTGKHNRAELKRQNTARKQKEQETKTDKNCEKQIRTKTLEKKRTIDQQTNKQQYIANLNKTREGINRIPAFYAPLSYLNTLLSLSFQLIEKKRVEKME